MLAFTCKHSRQQAGGQMAGAARPRSTGTPALCCCGCGIEHGPAIWRITAVCVHEHVWVLDFCEACMNEGTTPGGPRVWLGSCGDCFDERYAEDPETGTLALIGTGPLSHDCPLGPPAIERISALAP